MRTQRGGAILLALVCVVYGGWAWAEEERPPTPEKAEGVLRVVCFGDSLTGDRPWKRFSYQPHYLKYSDLLGLMLEGRLGVGKAEAFNSGWAGDMTKPKKNEGWPGAAGRVDKDILALKPDIVTILIGGNDRPDTPEKIAETETNLTAIVQACKKAGIRVLLLKYPAAHPGEVKDKKGNVKKGKGWPLDLANPVIDAVAAAEGVPTLDLGPPIAAAVKQYPSHEVVNPMDGVHLNKRGELVFARTIFAKLVELKWAEAPAAK